MLSSRPQRPTIKNNCTLRLGKSNDGFRSTLIHHTIQIQVGPNTMGYDLIRSNSDTYTGLENNLWVHHTMHKWVWKSMVGFISKSIPQQHLRTLGNQMMVQIQAIFLRTKKGTQALWIKNIGVQAHQSHIAYPISFAKFQVEYRLHTLYGCCQSAYSINPWRNKAK